MLAELALVAVGLHGPSFHSEAGFQTATLGVYAEAANGATAGVLINSEGRPGAYLGQTFHKQAGKLDFSLTAGVIIGYKALPLAPLLVPSIKHVDYPFRVSYLPRPPGGSDAFHVSYEIRF